VIMSFVIGLLKQKSSYISSNSKVYFIDEWPSGPPHTKEKGN